MIKALLQIRVESELKEVFQSICESSGLTQGDVLENMIQSYYTQLRMMNNIERNINKILEYSILVVKGMDTLPRDENSMKDIVNAKSRFDDVIERKLANGK